MQEDTYSDYAAVDRRGTSNIKMIKADYRKDSEPFVMTIADMDFPLSKAIR